MNLDQLFESFIQEKHYLQNCAPSTIKYFRQCYKTFRRIVQDDEITKQTLTQFVLLARQQKMSVGCLNSYIKGINSFLDWLKANEITTERLRIKLLKQEKKVLRSFTSDELNRIISFKPRSFIEKRIYTLTLALLDTGCRIDELLSLNFQQIDFDNLCVKVKGKGNKERIVPISVELRKILFRWLKSHNHLLVFAAKNGKKFNYQNAHRDFSKLLKRIRIVPIGFHALRRTFAKNYLRQGGNLFYLKAVLGHSRLETTQAYVEVESQDLQETHTKTSLLTRLRQ